MPDYLDSLNQTAASSAATVVDADAGNRVLNSKIAAELVDVVEKIGRMLHNICFP